MKAVVYQGPFSVSVENVPDPELQHPNDVIVKITSSCICGSDLHMYEGRTAAEPGIIFGHENIGHRRGSRLCGKDAERRRQGGNALQCGVRLLQELPEGFHRLLHHRQPRLRRRRVWICGNGTLAAAGRPSTCKYPTPTSTACPFLPATGSSPTSRCSQTYSPPAITARNLLRSAQAESVAVFGCGPVGLMAAYSCVIRGAAAVYAIDHVQERLDKASEIGAIAINFDDGDPVAQIREMRGGDGVDKTIDAVGYQAAAQGSSAAGGEQGGGAERRSEPDD